MRINLLPRVKLNQGEKMKNSKEVLTALLHTTQMGQTGIRSVMDSVVGPGLKQEMKDQLQQYDAIEKEALRLATARGWKIPNVNPGVRKMADIMSRARLMGGDVDSKIAGMLIQGNTRGMILGTKNLHRVDRTDGQIVELARKLLDRETVNIQKSQHYL